MAFDETLARRIRLSLGRRMDIGEKRMFGGVAFLLNGHMLVGVWKDSLIARIGLNAYAAALLEPRVREFDVTGRPMKGWVVVESAGVEDDELLSGWIQQALEFVATLPPK